MFLDTNSVTWTKSKQPLHGAIDKMLHLSIAEGKQDDVLTTWLATFRICHNTQLVFPVPIRSIPFYVVQGWWRGQSKEGFLESFGHGQVFRIPEFGASVLGHRTENREGHAAFDTRSLGVD